MAKKLKINEQQLSVIVEYIKTGDVKPIIKEELLEEGKLANWMMAGLATLASMGGSVQAQSEIDNSGINNVEALISQAQKVSNELKSDGDKAKLFRDAAKELNIQNIEDLKQINPKDDKIIKLFKTKNLKTADSKVKRGGVVTSIEITRDTTFRELPAPLIVDSTMETNLTGNLFVTGAFDLNEDVAEELATSLEAIKMQNGTLKNVKIHSSTDKEPISDELSIRLVSGGYTGDNEGLSKARKDGIYNYLVKKLGIDSSLIKLDIQWEQGPDVYSSSMSSADRASARDLEGTSEAREVGVTWGATFIVQGDDNDKVYDVTVSVLIGISSVETPLKGGYKPTKSGKGKMTIMKIVPGMKKLKCDNKKCFFTN